jgi:DNA gyrase subunit B
MPLPPQTELVKAVRKKPGMYLGGTDARALNTCLMQLVGNSIEQHLQGECATLTITLHPGGSASVQDDGPGISVCIDPRQRSGRSAGASRPIGGWWIIGLLD